MVLSPTSISRTSVYKPGGQTLYRRADLRNGRNVLTQGRAGDGAALPVSCASELLRLSGGALRDHDVDQRRAAEVHRLVESLPPRRRGAPFRSFGGFPKSSGQFSHSRGSPWTEREDQRQNQEDWIYVTALLSLSLPFWGCLRQRRSGGRLRLWGCPSVP